MRFAIIGSRGYPSTYGGFETFVRRLAPYLRDAGEEVTVYGRQRGVRTRRAEVDGIEVIETAGVHRKQLSTLISGLTASVHSRARTPDAALVLNCANGPFLPVLSSASIPTVVNPDGLEWEREKWSSVGQKVFAGCARATARFADRIVVDAQEIGHIWRETFGVDSTFIPYGADVHEVGADRLADLGLVPGTFVLVVARLVPENNVDLLLDALEHLPETTPVVIVGSANYDSPVQRRVHAAVEARPAVQGLGHVHDQELLSQLWGNCGVYFHGHSVGGTNPALLQALGYGSPTIAFDTPFNHEVLAATDQLVGREPRRLAGMIGEVLDDADRRAELTERGRTTIATRYRWDDVCAGYHRELIAASSGSAAAPTS